MRWQISWLGSSCTSTFPNQMAKHSFITEAFFAKFGLCFNGAWSLDNLKDLQHILWLLNSGWFGLLYHVRKWSYKRSSMMDEPSTQPTKPQWQLCCFLVWGSRIIPVAFSCSTCALICPLPMTYQGRLSFWPSLLRMQIQCALKTLHVDVRCRLQFS